LKRRVQLRERNDEKEEVEGLVELIVQEEREEGHDVVFGVCYLVLCETARIRRSVERDLTIALVLVAETVPGFTYIRSVLCGLIMGSRFDTFRRRGSASMCRRREETDSRFISAC
jgi:hypothetical protein